MAGTAAAEVSHEAKEKAVKGNDMKSLGGGLVILPK